MKRFLLIMTTALWTLTLAAQPVVVSHRGFYKSEGSWENTISSLMNAQKAGFAAVEFDVNMTKEDSLIVYHGPKIYGSDLNAQKDSWTEISKVVLPGGHKIPTLHEFLTQARKVPSTHLFLEIKKDVTPQRETKVVEKVLAMVTRMDMFDQIQIISFSKHVCDELVRLAPNAKVVYVSSDIHAPTPEDLKDSGYSGISYELNVMMNNPQIVDQANKMGMETTLWMSNDPEVIDWAVRHHITYISTDYPDKARAYLQSIASYKDKK